MKACYPIKPRQRNEVFGSIQLSISFAIFDEELPATVEVCGYELFLPFARAVILLFSAE